LPWFLPSVGDKGRREKGGGELARLVREMTPLRSVPRGGYPNGDGAAQGRFKHELVGTAVFVDVPARLPNPALRVPVIVLTEDPPATTKIAYRVVRVRTRKIDEVLIGAVRQGRQDVAIPLNTLFGRFVHFDFLPARDDRLVGKGENRRSLCGRSRDFLPGL
jgi:hypothetical protein